MATVPHTYGILAMLERGHLSHRLADTCTFMPGPVGLLFFFLLLIMYWSENVPSNRSNLSCIRRINHILAFFLFTKYKEHTKKIITPTTKLNNSTKTFSKRNNHCLKQNLKKKNLKTYPWQLSSSDIRYLRQLKYVSFLKIEG